MIVGEYLKGTQSIAHQQAAGAGCGLYYVRAMCGDSDAVRPFAPIATCASVAKTVRSEIGISRIYCYT